jgi:hypothetical protein
VNFGAASLERRQPSFRREGASNAVTKRDNHAALAPADFPWLAGCAETTARLDAPDPITGNELNAPTSAGYEKVNNLVIGLLSCIAA